MVISSEKEYWKEHKKFMKELKRVIRKRDFPGLNILFDNAEEIGLFSKEQIFKWREKILRASVGKF
jgi:hypothetical protein